MNRIDGADAWAALNPQLQAAIGALVLEWTYAAVVVSNHEVEGPADEPGDPVLRAIAAADQQLEAMLLDLVGEHVDWPELGVPVLLGQVCRLCGCSDGDACPTRCSWAEQDLCSACA